MIARKARSKGEQEQALEHVVYEMLILASALLVRDKRYFFAHYSSIQWGAAKIADDVIRIKSRLLREFLCRGPYTKKDDIICDDFSVPLPTLKMPPESEGFRARIENTGTVHLSWKRVGRNHPTKDDRQKMEEHALWLLDKTREFVEQCIESQFSLTGYPRHVYENVCRIHDHLKQTHRVDEDAGTRPRYGTYLTVPISLETLSV